MTDLVLDGAGANFDFIRSRFVARGSVDDEIEVAVFHHVDDGRALAFAELVEAFDGDALVLEALVGTAS